MQISVAQSIPCTSEELARANLSSMLTQIGSDKGGINITSINVTEASGMFIAVATYEIPDPKVIEEDAKKEEANTTQQNPEEADRDAEGLVVHTGANGTQIAADVTNGELTPEQTQASAFEPTTEPPMKPDPLAPTPLGGGEALKPDEEFLAEKVKDDFAEAKDPYNVDGNALVAERAAEAVSGLSPDQVEALKTEIERKLDQGMDPGIMPPGGDAKPSATPPGTTT